MLLPDIEADAESRGASILLAAEGAGDKENEVPVDPMEVDPAIADEQVFEQWHSIKVNMEIADLGMLEGCYIDGGGACNAVSLGFYMSKLAPNRSIKRRVAPNSRVITVADNYDMHPIGQVLLPWNIPGW